MIVIYGPGPLNIIFVSDMPITLIHRMLMSKIYVVTSDMNNVIGMSEPNVMFKGPGPLLSSYLGVLQLSPHNSIKKKLIYLQMQLLLATHQVQVLNWEYN